MKNIKFRLVLPILIILFGLLLAACVSDDAPASQPASENQTENIGTTPGADPTEETASEPLYTEPEAPPMTFPHEDVTAPQTEDPTDPAVTQTTPPETSGETLPFGGTLDENELPPIPFEP